METETPAPRPPAHDSGGPDDPGGGTARWRRGLLSAAALVGLVLGSTAVVMALDDRDPAPDDTPAGDEELVDPMPGGMALCAEVYSPQTLVQRDLVFVGTVLSITGDAINFDVEEVLRGDPGDQAQLGGAEFLTTPNPDNVNPIAVGDRLLVAGDGGFAWGCGFTHPYDEDVAAEWRAAFAG